MPQLNKIRQLEQKRNKKNVLHLLTKQKGVIIYRVSSHGQAKEGWSLEAQRKYLRAHADLHNIEIVQEFEEQESAKRAGRKVFNEMIKYLKKHKDVTNILVEKTDRLYRNFKDYVTLDELGINLHFVKENQVICPESRSHEKFVHGIKVLMAKNYIDNLREEILKGLNEKAEEGYYPGRAPVGYINFRDKNGKSYLIPDKDRAMFIRRIFVYYSQGNISMRRLATKLAEEGFKTKKGLPVNHKTIEHILQNPIYTGNFYWAGIFYEGKHKPIISEKLYDTVQAMFSNPAREKQRNEEALFTGIFKCGSCGKMITVERQKGAHNSGEYVYYRCGNNECERHYYVNEVKVDKFFTETLQSIRIKPEYVTDIRKGLLELHKIKSSDEQERLKKIHKDIEETEFLLSNLLDKYIRGTIKDDVYQKTEEEFTKKIKVLKYEAEELKKNKNDFAKYTENLLELCKDAPNLYLQASKQNKKHLIKMVCLNPTMTHGNLAVVLNPVFEKIKNLHIVKIGVDGGT